MPTMAMAWLLAIAAGLFAALAGVHCTLLVRRRGWGAGLLVGALRLAMLAVLTWLFWLVFVAYERRESEQELDPRHQRRVVLLQDASASMDFLADAGRSRAAFAEDVWRLLQSETGRLSTLGTAPPELQRYFFARNLVPEAERERLGRDGSQLGAAIAGLLARTPMEALLVVSDGAATDGAPPRYLVNWARNRHIGIYALCAAPEQGRSFDLLIARADCEPVNPERLQVEVSCFGQGEHRPVFVAEVDGRPLLRLELEPRDRQTIPVPLPKDLATGWHEFAVRVLPVAGEITAANNLQRGIFRVLPANRALFLYSRPRLENTQLLRLLRQSQPDRIEALAVRDERLAKLQPRDFRLLIVADLAPDQVPAAFLQAVREGKLALFVLAGERLGEWGALPGWPLAGSGPRRSLQAAGEPLATLRINPAAAPPTLRRLAIDNLTGNLFYPAQPAPQAQAVLQLRLGETLHPLLVADDLAAPRRLVFLSDASWKWAVAPEPRLRQEYRQLWNGIFAWLLGDESGDNELELEFSPDSADPAATIVQAAPRDPQLAGKLEAVRIEVGPGPGATGLPLRADGAVYRGRFVPPPERPAVFWFRGVARYADRELHSLRTPLLLQSSSAELLDTYLHPEKLSCLTADPRTQFGFYSERQALVQRLLRSLEHQPVRREARLRNPSRELSLAAIVVILIGIEWFCERRFKHRARPE